MKKQRLWSLIFSLILPLALSPEPASTISIPTPPTTTSLQKPTNFQMPENARMPSVSEIFGSMSEEEIIKQIQEAQRIFESLSPQEMEEFAKIVDQTYAQMSPQDLADIEGIANMVRPYFPEDQTTTTSEPKKPSDEPTAAPKANEPIGDNTIQTLIDTINTQINEILQKVSNNKNLAEEFTTKWKSKLSFDFLQRQILTLKQNRLAKKLQKKETPEDKNLFEKLENFYNELKNKNSKFVVEDEFGLPNPNKKINEQQLKNLQDILDFFDSSIDSLSPTLEAFLKKHDPEALEMAKEAGERTKKAKDVAKDSQVRRGSAPLASSTTPTPDKQRKDQSYQPGSYHYYDPYSGYQMPYGGPDSMTMNQPLSTSSPATNATPTNPTKKTDTTKKEEKKTEEQQKNKKLNMTSYDQAIDNLETYFDTFNNKADQDANNFLQNELQSYPDATNNNPSAPNPRLGPEGGNQQQQQNWIYSADTFKNKGFSFYTEKMNNFLDKHLPNVSSAQKVLEDIEKNIPTMSDEELKKLGSNKLLGQIKTRLNHYHDYLSEALDKINTQFLANKDPWKTFLTGTELERYELLHNQFAQNLLKLKSTIVSAKETEASIQRKIKRYQRKIKTAQEKKEQPK
ncbi:hypothetical protein HYV11_00710 [Candidatus Dependentiae bacterium]|nr:hypothetical protein [Candidatus Dependentiae bacterium]